MLLSSLKQPAIYNNIKEEKTAPMIRAPERWERWECVPSQFDILAATFC